MATVYSNYYGSVSTVGTASGAVTTSTSYIYKGPMPERKGEVCIRRCSYDLANGALGATNTVLKLCKLAPGEKFVRITISSGDDDLDSDNDYTFDFGTTTTSTLIYTASTVLQAGAETVLVSEELEELAAATAGDELFLTRAAGATGSSGTVYFLIESTIV
jgi:hypothetical protein